VSKFRVEFKSSKLLLILQLLTYGGLVLSVLNWQSEIIKYQFLLETSVVSIITFFVFRAILHSRGQTQTPVIFSLSGEWLETNIDGQIGWKITDKSRVSNLLLFIHLISPVNASHSKWCLIYKDQVTVRDFRRLCCAVIYQQQTTGKID
jgi:hypothetical protein